MSWSAIGFSVLEATKACFKRRNFAGLTRACAFFREDFFAFVFELAAGFFLAVADCLVAGFLLTDEAAWLAHVVPSGHTMARMIANTRDRRMELQTVYQWKLAPSIERSLSAKIRTSSCVK